MFSWTAPSIAARLTTAYSLTYLPLLAGIPAPQSLTLQPSVTSATVGGLYSGVGYNCSIATISGVGPSELKSVVLTTELYKKNLELHMETACMYAVPAAAPEMFTAEVGQREVVFSWSPPPVTQRNGVITSYNLSFSPSPSFLPQQTPSGPLTVTGFTPDTAYSCSVVATNSQGSGPSATTSFTTQQDCKCPR